MAALPSSAARSSAASPPRQLSEGVFCSEGTLSLPSTLRLAYRMWSNTEQLISPCEAVAVPSADDEPGEPASAQPSRLNILALHDSGDNAASFTLLAPALLQALSPQTLAQPPAMVCILAVDLAGHGMSEWRPRDGNYATPVHAVSDVSLLLCTVLRWRECILLGHGDGARLCMLLAASSALQLQHPMAASLPRLPAMLGAMLVDPFPYAEWRIERGRDEDYARESTRQARPGSLERSLPVRAELQRTRKTLYPRFQDGVSAYLRRHPDTEESSAYILQSRGLKYVKRPRVSPPPETLASLRGALDDEGEIRSPEVDACLLAASVGRSVAEPPPPRDVDPSKDEVGWVERGDPVRESPPMLFFARDQYAGALRAMVCPTLLLHARTQESALDRAFVRHVDALCEGSLVDVRAGPGSGLTRDVVADRLAHVDSESAGETIAFVSEAVRDAWNDRVNTRKDAAKVQLLLREENKATKAFTKQLETAFYERAREKGADFVVELPAAAQLPSKL